MLMGQVAVKNIVWRFGLVILTKHPLRSSTNLHLHYNNLYNLTDLT